MDESSGKVQDASTHIISSVVMDIAAFKVGLPSVRLDKDATALQAARARSSSIGAMEETSGKVQNASTHRLRRHIHKHAHAQQPVSSRASPRGRWRKAHGQFKRRAHIASLIGVHVAVGQRCRAGDEESPALPNMSMRNVPAGRWNVTCVGSSLRQNSLRTATTHRKQ